MSNPSRGLLCAGITTFLWGIQPIFMKLALLEHSSMAISWIRLTFAGLLTALFLSFYKEQPLKVLRRMPWLAWLGGAGLALNYFCFLKGIEMGGPALASVTIQVGPLILALLGVFYYKEHMSGAQRGGALLALLGFGVFYRDRLLTASDASVVPFAMGIVVLSALCWVVYCIAQKQLARSFNAQAINLAVYLTSCVLLAPLVEWSELSIGFTWPTAAVVYLSFSTLLAYACLAESFRHLPLSQVTFIIVCNPFITLIAVFICDLFGVTWVHQGLLSWQGYLGTFIAILGVSLTVALKQSSPASKAVNDSAESQDKSNSVDRLKSSA